MDHHLGGPAALARVAQVVGGEVGLVQQAGPVPGVAAAGHPALDQLEALPIPEGKRTVVPGAVVHHRPDGLRRAGGLHDGLVLAAVVEVDGEPPGLDLLTNVVAGVEDAAGTVGLIAPGLGAVPMFGHHLRLAGAEGDDRHGGGQGDLNCGGIAVFAWHHVHQAGREGRVLQTEVFAAELLVALHGGQILLGEAAVLQGQLHLLLGRDGDLQLGLVVLLVIAHREGDLHPVGPDVGDGVAGGDAEGHRLLLPLGILELVGGRTRHRAPPCVRRDPGGAAQAGHPLQRFHRQEGHGAEIRVAVVDEGLSGTAPAAAEQQGRGQQGAVYPPGRAGQRAQGAPAVPPDAQVGQGPQPRQAQQPGQAHVGGGAEDAEVGEIVGQGPDAGVEPAELPVVPPDGEAQGRQSGHQHQGQVKAAGELPRRPGQQDTQGEGQAHENEVGQQVIPAVKDGAHGMGRPGQPGQKGEGQGQRRRPQQGHQPCQGSGQGRHRRVAEHLHPAAGGTGAVAEGEQGKEQPAQHAPGQGGIGHIEGLHRVGRGGPVHRQPRQGGQDGEGGGQPGEPAPQQPRQLPHRENPDVHASPSPEMR